MKPFALPLLSLLTLALSSCTAPKTQTASAPTTAPAIVWNKWSADVFDRAKKENRFVLLDLEAVWCHWCHVMDENTYSDPTVQKLLADRYIAVRVDQDSRPDLSNRYEDYGWPATIVFDAAGHEIVKRQGYIPPKPMASMLQAIILDPTAGPSVTAEVEVQASDAPFLQPDARDKLIQRIRSAYDAKSAGWFGDHKFIDPDVAEYCLIYGDAELQNMARETLDANRKLIDPAWGGVYQYSTDSDWVHPHFEKIMSCQADDMRIYAQAFLATGNAADLQSAQAIDAYLRTFLTSPDGAFYVSQDADLVPGEHSADYFQLNDADRRGRGVPRIDQHIYSRENGWAIRSLLTLYAATGDDAVLQQAIDAAKWIIANRSIKGGGFHHGDTDPAGPYLGDTLSMGRAFLSLYQSTADRRWLARAQQCMKFIAANFVTNKPALVTAAGGDGSPAAPRPELDENIAAVRFANLLYAYTGDATAHDIAANVMRYIASPQAVMTRGWAVGGVLLADREMRSEPLHITVVGGKSDFLAATLFKTALRAPVSYKRVEWYDAAEGKLPRSDVDYPTMPTAVAFFCTGSACSSPMRDAGALRRKLSIRAISSAVGPPSK